MQLLDIHWRRPIPGRWCSGPNTGCCRPLQNRGGAPAKNLKPIRLAKIFGQDQPIVESQRPEFLPLDLQSELHLRSDRMAIAYRRWLNELGLIFGTA